MLVGCGGVGRVEGLASLDPDGDGREEDGDDAEEDVAAAHVGGGSVVPWCSSGRWMMERRTVKSSECDCLEGIIVAAK